MTDRTKNWAEMAADCAIDAARATDHDNAMEWIGLGVVSALLAIRDTLTADRGFSLKSAVVASFHDLCRNVARMQVPLVISYPSSGLLGDAGVSVSEIALQYFGNVHTLSYNANHSTVGASTGASKKSAMENLYVCLA